MPLNRKVPLADWPAMTFRRAFLVSLLGVLATTGLPAQSEPTHPERKGEVTELGQWMDRMNSAFRKLRRQVALPEHNEASRELVAQMTAAAEKARELTPEKIAETAESERAKFLEGYRTQMDELIVALRKLDAALAENDNAAAGEIVRDLRGLQRAGHQDYKTDRD